MKVDDFFEKYPNIISNMSMQNKNKVVDFTINYDYIVPEDKIPQNMNIKQVQSTNNGHELKIVTANHSFEDICDFVEEIIIFNEELEKKKEFFLEKYEELQKLFNDHDLEELKDLQFNLPNQNSQKETNDSVDKNVLVNSQNGINNNNQKRSSKEKLK